MTVGFTFKFDSDFSKLHQFMTDMPGKAGKFLDGIAEDMVTDMQLSMGTSPPGRTYVRRDSGGNIVVHVASRPGYPPNPDEASLRNSLKWKRDGVLRRRLEDGVQHGRDMELGTGKVKARPFMTPIFEKYGPGGELIRIARSLDLAE